MVTPRDIRKHSEQFDFNERPPIAITTRRGSTTNPTQPSPTLFGMNAQLEEGLCLREINPERTFRVRPPICTHANNTLAKFLRPPRIELGTQAWEACMIPLHHRRHDKCVLLLAHTRIVIMLQNRAIEPRHTNAATRMLRVQSHACPRHGPGIVYISSLK